MFLTRERQRFLAGLIQAEPLWGGMGAMPLSPDPRDRQVTQIPAVARALAALPPSVDLSEFIGSPVYNQGQEGACVAFSTAGLCSLDTDEGKEGWEVFDAQKLYTEAGGTGQNGVDSRLVLSNCVNLGTPKPDGTRQKIVGSYAFVTQQPGAFRQQIMACLAANLPVVIGAMLPSDWGWESGQPSALETTGYHQFMGCGYYTKGATTYAKLLNSWGPDWPGGASPGPGLGSISFDYLEKNNCQQGYAFAYTTTSLILPAPNPNPSPIPLAGISDLQTMAGTSARTLAGNTEYRIIGSGFGTTPGTVTVVGFNAAVVAWSDAQINFVVQPPLGIPASTGSLVVKAGTQVLTAPFAVTLGGQPSPNPNPNPNPNPSPSLSVTVNLQTSDGRRGAALIPVI